MAVSRAPCYRTPTFSTKPIGKDEFHSSKSCSPSYTDELPDETIPVILVVHPPMYTDNQIGIDADSTINFIHPVAVLAIDHRQSVRGLVSR